MKTYVVRIERTIRGARFIPLPDELLKELGWTVGTLVKIEVVGGPGIGVDHLVLTEVRTKKRVRAAVKRR